MDKGDELTLVDDVYVEAEHIGATNPVVNVEVDAESPLTNPEYVFV